MMEDGKRDIIFLLTYVSLLLSILMLLYIEIIYKNPILKSYTTSVSIKV